MFGAEFKIAFIALSLGLDVFAVCIGVGMRGVPLRERIRIGAAFTVAEMTMSVLGVLFGQLIGRFLGDFAAYLGFIALFGLGIYMIVEAVREGEGSLDLSTGWGLFIGAASISLDSLGIGFSLLYIGVPIVVSLVTIGATTVLATVSGLALGRALGARVGEYAGIAAGIVLALTGIAFSALKYFHG